VFTFFPFSSSSSLISSTLRKRIIYEKELSGDNDENEFVIRTSCDSNNNKSITMSTMMCLEIGDKRRNAYIFFFPSFPDPLELVLPVGARWNTHSSFFFSSKQNAHVNDFFTFSLILTLEHTYTMIIILIITVL
jgi:hypothetical protein